MIDDLDVITGVLGQHRADLEEGLSTFPAGLAPYGVISSYGQWFQVRLTVTCLAGQSVCIDEGALKDPLDGLDPGSAGAESLLGMVFGFATQGVRGG